MEGIKKASLDEITEEIGLCRARKIEELFKEG